MKTARHRERLFGAVVGMLGQISLDAPLGMESLTEPLKELLEADQSYVYAARRSDDGRYALDFVHTSGSPLSRDKIQSGMAALVGGGLPRWGFFDPERPERTQQNRALVVPIPGDAPAVRNAMGIPPEVRRLGLSEQKAWEALANEVALTSANTFRRLHLGDQSQLRVLVCEHGKLLAWVGGFRDPARPFGRSDRQLLQRLTPALQRRLRHERLLRLDGARALAFDAALEAVPAAAFLLDRNGQVLHANAAGLEALQRDSLLRERLKEVPSPDAPHGFTISRFSMPGAPPCFLAIRARAEADPRTLLPYFTREWGLTPRQSEVLGLLAAGESNRSIGVELGASERTIEHHVTQLLEKAQVDSRAALVAQFWKIASRKL